MTVKTSQQREDEFRADLAALLEKHHAELEVTDDGKPHGMHNGICRITMMNEFDDGEEVAQFAQFDI